MGEVGLEPTRPYGQGILNPQRLPFRHTPNNRGRPVDSGGPGDYTEADDSGDRPRTWSHHRPLSFQRRAEGSQRMGLGRKFAFAALLAGVIVTGSAPVLATGPDIIVGEIAILNNINRYGPLGRITAFSFATTSCNIGDMEAAWFSNTPDHPVIAQNIYRLKAGRFEQIGMAWLKHGFATLNDELPGCGTCQPTDGQTLGPGCSDTYEATLNGAQGLLGPRSQVNPSSGEFPYPFAAPAIQPIIGRRIQVKNRDLDPIQNPGALYFLEAFYISAHESIFNNAANNASWRRVTVTSEPLGYKLTPAGSTVREEPAVFAWKANDPTVQIQQVVIENDGGPGYFGYFWVASKATYRGNCTWRYEYAVENLNSHQACGAFSVSLPGGVTPSWAGRRSIRYHSGEPYLPFSWMYSWTDSEIRWETYPFAEVPNANAIRFGTLYNFRFDVQAPPTCEGAAAIHLFRSPHRDPYVVQVIGPTIGDPCLQSEPTDFSCEAALVQPDRLPGDVSLDGTVDEADVQALVDVILGRQEAPEATLAADIDESGVVDGHDIAALVNLLTGSK